MATFIFSGGELVTSIFLLPAKSLESPEVLCEMLAKSIINKAHCSLWAKALKAPKGSLCETTVKTGGRHSADSSENHKYIGKSYPFFLAAYIFIKRWVDMFLARFLAMAALSPS